MLHKGGVCKQRTRRAHTGQKKGLSAQGEEEFVPRECISYKVYFTITWLRCWKKSHCVQRTVLSPQKMSHVEIQENLFLDSSLFKQTPATTMAK